MKKTTSIIPKTWTIPQIFRNRLGEDVGRQRLMVEDEHLLVILHQIPNHQDKAKREAALFWVDDHDHWKSTPNSGGRQALADHVNAYLSKIDYLDEQLDHATSANDVFSVIEQATPIHRAARNMHTTLQQLRETLPDDEAVLDIRDLAIKTERAAELLLSDAKSTLDYQIASNAAHQAHEAEKSANEAKKLNRLAALFFPTVTLASIFGMNAPSEVLTYPNFFTIIAAGAFFGIVLWFILKQGDQ